MKQKNILFIFFVALSAVFACERVDESKLEGNNTAVETVEMTFNAVIDREGDTKTVLEGELGDGVRKVMWQPGDAIGVSSNTLAMGEAHPGIYKCTAEISMVSEVAEFKGSAPLGTTYRAFYPYTETLRDSIGSYFIFNLPSEQKYVRDSFDPKAAPMVATASFGETFQFRNLCGVLALQLKGEETVTSITFKGISEDGSLHFVVGDFEVNPFAEGDPEIRLHNNGRQAVTLVCESPVELDTEEATAFYFVLPPATYHKFNITIKTEDGQIMIKEGTRPLTIKRADVQPTAALQYVETVPIDLSEHGNANSYIVSHAGLYSFDASTIGNGAYGIIEGAGFHTEDPTISPTKAALLWQDRGVIEDFQFDASSKQIRFTTTGREGNAVFAAKDDNENILWSWHIWATDEPSDQNYVNSAGEFTVMDRNLGAIRADRGENEHWREARGAIYQWGRKDPMPVIRHSWGEYEGYEKNPSRVSIVETIKNPTVLEGAGFNNWHNTDNTYLWSVLQKTIYDPCPVGYRVPSNDIWKGFTTTGYDQYGDSNYYNVSGAYENGWMFRINDSDISYYPSTIYTDYNGYLNSSSSESFVWSAGHSSENYAYDLRYNYYNDVNSSINLTNSSYKSNAYEIRCMKDETHVDLAYPTVDIADITDVTIETATVHVNIANDGSSAVSARGIVWGTQSGLTIETGNVISEPQDLHEFSAVISGLQHSTRYYVRAYATNERGTGYSKELSFVTLLSGEAVDLSEDGTANCYIVPPVFSEYSFDASVKGNSKESVGEIDSVEVLWETSNNNNNIKEKSVISSVELKGNRVHFQLPFDVKPGNALIAVKDALGTILWSWHIWVVDFDPVETQQTLVSGAVIMDRNLGATGVVPGSIESFGFYYQWGRKDPFVIPGYMTTAPGSPFTYTGFPAYDTIEHSVQHPMTIFNDVQWGYVDNLWDSSKTKYDPCPSGWRVSDKSAWKSLYRTDNSQEGYFQLSPTSGSPTVYIPAAGRTDGDINIAEYRYGGYIWLSERGNNLYCWVWNGDVQFQGYYGVDNLMSVRCMKDMSGQSGSGNDYIVDDEFDWE